MEAVEQEPTKKRNKKRIVKAEEKVNKYQSSLLQG